MESTPLRPTPDSITPNPNDASNHCNSCKNSYSTRENYINYLERIHKMIIPKLPKPTRNPNILPDVDDPNFCCKSCQFKYKSRGNYRIHLQQTHKMDLLPLKKKTIFDPTISVADTKNPDNSSCAICKLKYHSRDYYEKHMLNFYTDGRNTPVHRRSAIIAYSDIPPDPNDPNFHCATCQRRYSTKHYYRRHIRLYHPNIKLETRKHRPNTLIVEIDAGNDRNTICTICRRDYNSRRNYRHHMITYIRMVKRNQ